MPSRTPRLQFPRQAVTAVVVVHDGAHLLPHCLDAIRNQRRRPQRLVVVDTGSADGSADLVGTAGEEIALVRLPRDTGFPDAVAAGLAAADDQPSPRRRGPTTGQVWLLHDDCRPEPDALYELLAEAERSESSTVLGCKQVDLDGRHLVEVGVTIDGTGRRRTGVDAHEVDQGQHDVLREVLAVSTAGMLVRRDVWDRLGGLDPAWPLFGEDLDFGWRANAAGERVVVVPAAVVRHDFGLSTMRRAADAVSDRPTVAKRRHGLQVVLANTAAWLVPLLIVRAVVSGMIAAGGQLLSGHGRAAADELAIIGSTLRSLPVLAVARRTRRPLRVRRHREIRPLLARGSAPGRRDMDALVARLRRGLTTDRARRGWRDRPLLWLTLGLVVVAAVADRGLLGGLLHGGRLLPPPAGAPDLWSLYRDGWHGVGVGSTAPTPPWVAVLATASTVLFGKPWLVVDLLVLGAVPLAGWTAYAAGSAVTRSRWLRALAAAAYALLPVTTGAVAGGRLDVVVVVVLLPVTGLVLVRAVRPTAEPSPSRPVLAGLLLALSAAFAPALWAVVGVVGLAVIGMTIRPVGRALARLAVALMATFLALVPWSWSVAAHPSLALRGLGPVDTFALSRPQAATDLVLLHPGGGGQPPAWLVAGYLLAAVAALSRRSSRGISRSGFAAFVVALAVALATSRLDVPGGVGARYWTGVPLAVASLAALCCATAAADGARAALARHSFGWRQAAAGLVTAAVVVAVIGTVGAWIGRGAAHPLTARSSQLLPAFAAATVGLPTAPRALVLRARRGGVAYALVRSAPGPRLGDADLAPAASTAARVARARLSAAVARLAGGDPDAAPLLTAFGITQVVTRTADDRLLPGLVRVDGLIPVPGNGVVVRRTAATGGELVVLDPGVAFQARVGQEVTASTRPLALPIRAGRASTRLRAGPDGRLLVLAEPVDTHWRASLDGRPLHRSTAYGWAQAWQLPARGGRLEVSRGSDGRGRRLLLELGALVILGVAARPRHHPRAGVG